MIRQIQEIEIESEQLDLDRQVSMPSFQSIDTIKKDVDQGHAILSKLQKQTEIVNRKNDNIKLRDQIHRVTNSINLIQQDIISLKAEKMALAEQVEHLTAEYNFENVTQEVI